MNISNELEVYKDKLRCEITELVTKGNIHNANILIDKYIKELGIDSSIYIILANIYIKSNMLDNAKKILIQGLNNNTENDTELIYKLGYVYELIGLYTDAESIYNSILKDKNISEEMKKNITDRINKVDVKTNGERQKKIYFILEHLGGRGGVETAVTTVINELENRGYSVSVFLPNRSDDTEWENNISKVYYYKSIKESKTGLDFVINRVEALGDIIFKIGMPDIIVGTHMPITTLYSRLIAGYASNIPVISWLHGNPNIYFNPEYINYADISWSISDKIKENIDNILTDNLKSFYIGNPIDIKIDKLDVTTENKFVYIGRLNNNEKRIDIILQALSLLKCNWTLDIYGDGEHKEYIEDLIKNLNLNNKVTMHGYVKNPWQSINNIKALLLASDHEGFGLVIGEALARGIPVVATKADGPIELVHEGKNGFLVEKGSIEEFREKINKLISCSESELKELSNNAIKSIEKYSIKNVVDRMESTFNFKG